MWLMKVAVRVGMVVHYTFILVYKHGVKYPAKLVSFGGPWKYLTHWNLWFQLGYFSTALVNELFSHQMVATKSSEPNRLQKIRDYLFSTVSFPFGTFVSVVFSWLRCSSLDNNHFLVVLTNATIPAFLIQNSASFLSTPIFSYKLFLDHLKALVFLTIEVL